MLLFFGAVSLLLPSEVTITKSIQTVADTTSIKNEIQDLNQWQQWFPADSMNVEIKGERIIISDNNGEDKLTVNAINVEDLSFQLIASSGQQTDLHFIIIPHNDYNQITLNAVNHLGWYPWTKIRGIFLEKMSGPFYEHLLQQLKVASEKSN